MSESEEISEPLMEFVEAQADAYDLDVQQTVKALERQYGITLSDVSDDDAEEFVRAVEEGDGSTIEDLLIEYGASDEAASEFREMIENTPDEPEQSGGENRGNGDSPPAEGAGGGSGVGEERVRQIVRDEAGAAVREAIQSAQAQQPAPEGGGGNSAQQQQMIMKLASQFLNDGGGQAAALGEEVQNQAMKAFIKDLQKPGLGDILEMKAYKRIADSEEMEREIEALYGDPDDEDSNSVMGMFDNLDGGDDSEDD